MLFQAPINRALHPVTLSLERRTTSIFQRASSPYLFSSNIEFEGMCYAQNCLPHLLWDGCSQVVLGSLHCLNQRSRGYHLQEQTVFDLYRRFAALCSLVIGERLQRCVHGVHRKVLDSHLQHFRTDLQYRSGLYKKFLIYLITIGRHFSGCNK